MLREPWAALRMSDAESVKRTVGEEAPLTVDRSLRANPSLVLETPSLSGLAVFAVVARKRHLFKRSSSPTQRLTFATQPMALAAFDKFGIPPTSDHMRSEGLRVMMFLPHQRALVGDNLN